MWMLVFWGCPASTTDEADDDAPADSDTDTDLDTDTDTDTDVADTDTDTTADTDTDTTADTDCDPAYLLPASDSDADLALAGTDVNQSTARSVLVVDHDGDGFDDLLIGSPDFDSLAGIDAGRVWITYGPVTTDGELDLVADGWADAVTGGDEFGAQLASLGDIDDDGLADIAAHAPDGELWIRYGSAARLTGAGSAATWDASVASSGQPIGEGVTSAGDLDGDGHDDVVFANPSFDGGSVDFTGRLYVLAGSTERVTGEIDEQVLPFVDGTEDARICTGRCIGGEDYDGDGLVDLAFAVDAVSFPGMSRVWVRYGDGTMPDGESVDYYPRLQTDSTDGSFGTTLGFVGDLDGDGYPELAFGDEYASTQTTVRSGRVWVVRGGARWVGNGDLDSRVWLTITGVEGDQYVGSAIQGLGDVDCDGFDDLAIGAEYAEGVSDLSGLVGVWLAPTAGADVLDDATAQILGVVGGGGFGASLGTGDVDGDGAEDLVVGAPYASGTGRAWLFLDVL